MIWGGAFNTENFRAGFEAVPTRFREAGYALGFAPLKTFLNVTLPIGGRIALPSSINTYISVLKNTSLLLVIGYAELTNVANNIQSLTFRTFEMFTVLAVVYLAHRLDAVGADPPARGAARASGGRRRCRELPDWFRDVAEYILREGLPGTLKLAAIAVTASLSSACCSGR